jgi:hypothetical protein
MPWVIHRIVVRSVFAASVRHLLFAETREDGHFVANRSANQICESVATRSP